MTQEEINVHVGEVKTGSGNQVLRALLGSCIGVAILWPERNIFGLAHCLLSKSPDKNFKVGGKYVDQAIHSLVKLMNITKEDFKKVKAVVAGGGNMTKPEGTESSRLVGHNNKKCALETLSELKIKVVHEDTGGTNGRRISINCDTGSFDVKAIPRPKAV